MESSQRKGIRRKNLQCPFTWSSLVLQDEDFLCEVDRLAIAPDTWALVLSKILLAYQCLMRDDVKSSQTLLAECYIPLLEVDGFYKNDSDLISQYRPALKHVIDSTWAFVCCKTTRVKDLEPFLQSILPFVSMTDAQKSAIWGIRGRLTMQNDGLRAIELAISLNPDEGQWHLYKGFLYHLRGSAYLASPEELKALETAYNLRTTPESMVAYAVALTHQHRRVMDTKRGLLLLRDALIKWPNNPYVNLECGAAFYRSSTKPDGLALAEKCLRHAAKFAGPRNCKTVYQALGSFLIHHKDKAEGKMYLHMCSNVQDITSN